MPVATKKAPKGSTASSSAKSPTLESLLSLIPPIFTQVQTTAVNHKKNCVALRKIQDKCGEFKEEVEREDQVVIRLIGEKKFNNTVLEMMNRVLVIKKGVNVADKVIHFMGKFVNYTSQQDAKAGSKDDEDEDDELPDTVATRFINKLIKHLLLGSEAKDKNVRYRVLQLLVTMINGLENLDDDLYTALRRVLLARAYDKETPIRVQAAIGLGQLADGEEGEDEDEDDEDEDEDEDDDEWDPDTVPLRKVLLDLLQYDPAPEVRRAALYGLPRSPKTLPAILERARDIDVTLRRIVYAGPLSAKSLPDPRALTVQQRERVVLNGLSDREAAVRRAAANMLAEWLDGVEGNPVDFLKRFDLLSSKAAADALLSLFSTRKEALNALEFDGKWNREPSSPSMCFHVIHSLIPFPCPLHILLLAWSIGPHSFRRLLGRHLSRESPARPRFRRTLSYFQGRPTTRGSSSRWNRPRVLHPRTIQPSDRDRSRRGQGKCEYRCG